MKNQRLPDDRQLLVEQFLKLSPAARLRQAFGMMAMALSVRPTLLQERQRLLAVKRAHRSRRGSRRSPDE